MKTLWRVSYTLTTPAGASFPQTVREVEAPDQETAKRRARRVMRNMFPSCRCRTRKVCRDRKGEAYRAKMGLD